MAQKAKYISLLFGLLAGCIESRLPKDFERKKAFIVGIESEVKNLDLRSSLDANTGHVMKLFAQSLLQIGPDLRPEPDLCASYEVKNKGKDLIFHLPPDLHFGDGSRLTVRDIWASYVQASGPTSRNQSAFKVVDEFKIVDELTFMIRLKEARPSFLSSEVAAINIAPEKQILGKENIESPLGSGPFQFYQRTLRDLIFKKNPWYRSQSSWAPKEIFYDYFVVRTIEDPITRFLSIVSGDIDGLFNALAPKKVKELEGLSQVQVLKGVGSTYQYLGIQLKNPKFRDVRIRQAIAHAIDRESLIKFKLMDFARPANSLLTPQNFFYNAQLPQISYDVSEAKRLLKAAGAEAMELELKSSSDREVVSVLQVVKKNLEDVGFRVNYKVYEFATFFADVLKGQSELFSLRWTSVTDPELLSQVFHSREFPPGKNRVYYSNPKLDKILDQAEGELDSNRRKRLYDEAQVILLSDLPYVPLWYPDNIVVAQREIKNLVLHPTGSWISVLKSYRESP